MLKKKPGDAAIRHVDDFHWLTTPPAAANFEALQLAMRGDDEIPHTLPQSGARLRVANLEWLRQNAPQIFEEGRLKFGKLRLGVATNTEHDLSLLTESDCDRAPREVGEFRATLPSGEVLYGPKRAYGDFRRVPPDETESALEAFEHSDRLYILKLKQLEFTHVHPYFEFLEMADESGKNGEASLLPLSPKDLAAGVALSLRYNHTTVRISAIVPNGHYYFVDFRNGQLLPEFLEH